MIKDILKLKLNLVLHPQVAGLSVRAHTDIFLVIIRPNCIVTSYLVDLALVGGPTILTWTSVGAFLNPVGRPRGR